MTAELYQERLSVYCKRYRVAPLDTGLPPFPTGQRETPQHKEWISLYKAHQRIGRRDRGQCERCAAPAGPGSVFCEAHRGAGSKGLTAGERHALLEAQGGRCPVCREPVEASAPVHGSKALLHPRCHQLAGLAEALGPAALDRLRAYLWPPKKKR